MQKKIILFRSRFDNGKHRPNRLDSIILGCQKKKEIVGKFILLKIRESKSSDSEFSWSSEYVSAVQKWSENVSHVFPQGT